MKDYELYIFDFDMTLVDSLKPSIGCYRKAFEPDLATSPVI